MTLQLPDELIQRAVDNGFNLYGIKLLSFDKKYSNSVVFYIDVNQMKGYDKNNYELLFNPDLKFLEYALRDNDPPEEQFGILACIARRELILCESSDEQTEYLKTLIW